VFRYDAAPKQERTIALAAPRARSGDNVGVAFIGAGNYAKAVLLPALPKSAQRRTLIAATGASARASAARFGFESCSTDAEAALADASVDLVVVATRHDSHAQLAARALRAGKAVWLEKPVAISEADLAQLEAAARETGGFLAVGYNRRFSRHARAIRAHFAGRAGPLAIQYLVAAGAPPRGSWVLDPKLGGGRVVGEVCHFVDLCSFLIGAPPTSVFARRLGRDPEGDDSTSALLGFADGSVATIEYLAATDASLPKERFEVSGAGRTARCDDFRETTLLERGRSRTVRSTGQDKAQETAVREVIEAVRAGAASPFGLHELLAVSRATFAIEESVRTGREVLIDRT
jgi:predicted dehydrogenase